MARIKFGTIFENKLVMKNTLFSFFILVTMGLQAQHSISGTFMPAKDYKWLIAYRLKPGTQNYVADTAVQNGMFSLKIPENSQPGTYRLVYAVPQEEFYFDVIYNGKEDISLAFDTTNGVSFIASEENISFNSYIKKINSIEQQVISFYKEGKTDEKMFENIIGQLKEIQTSFDTKTDGLIAHQFILANNPYIPSGYESIQDYVKNKKQNYFNSLDFKNPILQASGFLTDKIVNYVFTALPLEPMTQQQTENVIQNNIMKVDYFIHGVAPTFKLHIFYTLWAQAAASTFNKTSDFIYYNYLKALTNETKNQDIIDKIEMHNRLRFGATAPEITWKDGDSVQKLSDMEAAENYVLIFWSSSCSHCLRELPALHSKLKNNESVKVVAIGLEDEDITWKQESVRMPHFKHVIALGKWESKYAKLYDIHQTPSYFILDKDKRIIAKPEDDVTVIKFLRSN